MSNYPDSLLSCVQKPARYTGGEWNAVRKDFNSTPLRFALSYPDTYEIGMSNMAIGILYEQINARKDCLAERVFAPWVDMAQALRENRLPLRSLESGHALGEFDVIGFSLGYEFTFTNILNMLDLAGLPVLSAERGKAHPLVIGGGSAALNPEPVADFIDLFVIGEAEEMLDHLIDLILEHKQTGSLDKPALLREAARLPGVYVPALYDASYIDGKYQQLTPRVPEAPPQVQRQILSKLRPAPVKPVVPYIEAVHDRAAIEIARGCSHGCRFCNAGMIYRPVRERPREEVLAAIEEILQNTGYDEVSLVSLSSGDYSQIDTLVADLSARYGERVALSLPSLHLDPHAVKLVDGLPGRRKTGLTFAVEAGSPRLQKVINKHIPEEEILATAALAFERGWTGLKLYFMLGLPTETDEDVQGIIDLVGRVKAQGRSAPGRAPQIRLTVSTFVPKPHTPFQWAAQESAPNLARRHEMLRNTIGRRGVKLSYSDTRVSLLEAVMSRGDRRVGKAIYRAWKAGAVFDGWSEHFNFELWQAAMVEEGVDPAFYATRERPLDEPLPWAHIDIGVSNEFLKQEFQKAISGELTPDCRTVGCNACGLQEKWCRE
ncbi:MAG: TIGR03960 family B12-binding radical SAM protein [Dehalococcoidia bacterium]|nr:TIGR03960 family B12-binding radical SAM protein [Dehalococcoidia bacterium]